VAQSHIKSCSEKIHSQLQLFAPFWRKIRWYEIRWKVQLDKLPESERDKMLFMLAARWADDIRTAVLPKVIWPLRER
jgi:hypothetical protein